MSKLFGTDGIRAVAGQHPLDYTTVCTLGEALIDILHQEGLAPKVLIGRDTRESGKWLEQALFQGIQAKKGEAVSTGILPTSAVSFLTKKLAFSAGVVISASHNPYQDNGIKIFSHNGRKISQVWEEKLERAISSPHEPVREKTNKIKPNKTHSQEYIRFLTSRFGLKSPKQKFKLVIDCANGASSFVASHVFSELGFDVVATSAAPDGKNINVLCGSLFPEKLAEQVLANKADLGIAFDGDADRAIWVDEKGNILNGDHTLFVQSQYMQETGRMKSGYVVATTMSNMGLEKALEKFRLKLVRAKVGDKFVLEEMIKLGANLGGEQSGHTIFLDDCPTGDGILTSIKMLEAMTAKQASLSELVKDYHQYPQILLNVPVSRKDDFGLFPEIVSTAKEIENSLGNNGRFNLRYSGTEPVARVMVEGQDQGEIQDFANRMAEVLAKILN
jgi:phosphoglucosamine mutase